MEYFVTARSMRLWVVFLVVGVSSGLRNPGWIWPARSSTNLSKNRGGEQRSYDVVESTELLGRGGIHQKTTRRRCSPLRSSTLTDTTTTPEESAPWAYLRSHSEVAITPEQDDNYCELPGTSEVRCVATAQHHLVWRRAPKTVLLLAKMHAGEDELELAAHIAESLSRCGAEVYLAQPLYGSISRRLFDSGVRPALWQGYDETAHEDEVSHIVRARPDAVATLGGDGLLLYANSLFQTVCPPPIVAFSGGSLGFLAPFDIPKSPKALDATISPLIRGTTEKDGLPSPWPVSLRMRLRCRLLASNGTEIVQHEALNEVVIDRGTSRFLSAVEIFCNDEHLTTVQADGLIVATPTGSTAYSLAAGGPLVHPSTPAIVMSPICAHSLSFRPIAFPDSVVLRFEIQQQARSPAWITFDGRRRAQLGQGECLEVTVSPYPLPTLLKFGNTADWFSALRDAFNFNTRAAQQPLPASNNNNGDSVDFGPTSQPQ